MPSHSRALKSDLSKLAGGTRIVPIAGAACWRPARPERRRRLEGAAHRLESAAIRGGAYASSAGARRAHGRGGHPVAVMVSERADAGAH